MALFNSGLTGITNLGTATPSSFATSTTAANALAANTSRKRFLVFNPPTNTIVVYIGFAAGVTTANGIPLAPGQGWIEESNPPHTGVVSAIAASGTPSIVIWEWQ